MRFLPGLLEGIYRGSLKGCIGFRVLDLLGGSWDLVSEVINNVAILKTQIKVLITLLTKSHDPPSGFLLGD